MTTEPDKQIKSLMGRLTLVLAGLGLVLLFRSAVPDIVRYMKIRSM